MLKTFVIEIKDKRLFCGWQNFQHKQGRVAVFANNDAKIYHEESAAEFDIKLLRKRRHQPKLINIDELCDCGHSMARHKTAGGFCKHCTCNGFVTPNKA